MSNKSIAIVDPHFRTMNEIFSGEDRKRPENMVNIIGGQDEPNAS